MVAYRGRRILAIGNEAYEMFEKSPSDISDRFSHGFWNACESRITGNRTLQHVEKDRSYIRPWCGYVFFGSS